MRQISLKSGLFRNSLRPRSALAAVLASCGVMSGIPFPLAVGAWPMVSAPATPRALPVGPSFRPSSDNPYPEETESSGVRNDLLCVQDQDPPADRPASATHLQAIAPDNALKLTASGRPTFWVALPPTQATQVILSIEKINPADQSKTFHSQKSYSIAATPALMGLPMPDDAPDLEVNAIYQWSAILVCGETPHPSDPFVFATIKRMTPASPVKPDQPTFNSTVLSQAGFWYDPVSILLVAHQNNPQDQTVIQSWRSLMKSAGLDTVLQHYGPNKSAIQMP